MIQLEDLDCTIMTHKTTTRFIRVRVELPAIPAILDQQINCTDTLTRPRTHIPIPVVGNLTVIGDLPVIPERISYTIPCKTHRTVHTIMCN